MATGQLDKAFKNLRRVVLLREGAGIPDGRLLQSFISEKDEAAFEALVRRHSSMVWSVCRRLVRNYHDAEDAFQATFLVLALKASSIRPRDMVGSWLHGVAYRTALKALRSKRQVRERQVRELPELPAMQPDHCNDLRSVIDKELTHLTEIYRLPVLLCDVEGKSIKEAMQQLGWPQGTVAGRLARGRKLLAKRLFRLGLPVIGGSLLFPKSAAGSVPYSLISSTVREVIGYAAGTAGATGVVSANVATLMEGVVKTMWLKKLMVFSTPLLLAEALIAVGGRMVVQGAIGQPVGILALKEEKAAMGQLRSTAANGEAAANGATETSNTPGVKLPTVAQLVDYVNDNAQRLRTLRCTDLEMTVTQGIKSFGLRGSMAAEKPRRFRLSARALGNPVLDFGSNEHEFWYWLGKSDPPHQIHCS